MKGAPTVGMEGWSQEREALAKQCWKHVLKIVYDFFCALGQGGQAHPAASAAAPQRPRPQPMHPGARGAPPPPPKKPKKFRLRRFLGRGAHQITHMQKNQIDRVCFVARLIKSPDRPRLVSRCNRVGPKLCRDHHHLPCLWRSWNPNQNLRARAQPHLTGWAQPQGPAPAPACRPAQILTYLKSRITILRVVSTMECLTYRAEVSRWMVQMPNVAGRGQ